MKTINSKSFLEVADQVQALKQQGYVLVQPIHQNEGGYHTANLTQAQAEIIDTVPVSTPKYKKSKDVPVEDKPQEA